VHDTQRSTTIRVAVVVRMRMPKSMAVIVPVAVPVVVVTARGPHAEQVDRKPDTAHEQQLARLHLGRVHDALDALEDDEDRDEDEEAALRQQQ
jgi:hypothetical protein